MQELPRQIQPSDESEVILLKISNVLLSIDDCILKETARKIKSQLNSGIIQTIHAFIATDEFVSKQSKGIALIEYDLFSYYIS